MKSFFLAVLALACAVLAVPDASAQDYRIRPGDTLRVEVLEDSSLNRNLLVTPDGSISFPFAGSLAAQGFTTDQVAARLSAAIAPNFAVPPNVFISVTGVGERVATGITAAPATVTVYFMGEVGDPGARDVQIGTTFLQALSQAGGLTNFAAERRIQVRRTDPQTLTETVVAIDYRALQRGARLSQNIVLAEGDVILVPQRGLFE